MATLMRMLKMAANEAAGEQKPEAYPLGYVEDFLRVENEVDRPFSAAVIRRPG